MKAFAAKKHDDLKEWEPFVVASNAIIEYYVEKKMFVTALNGVAERQRKQAQAQLKANAASGSAVP